jgi:hypothetical protein
VLQGRQLEFALDDGGVGIARQPPGHAQGECIEVCQSRVDVGRSIAGGTGKTRLAEQVAAYLLARYAQGVWLVELAPLADAALVPQAVATVLGVQEETSRPG